MLGKSEFASQCVIDNPEILEFEWHDDVLSAKAMGTLKIRNNALGYKIDFVLINFYWKQKEGKTRYIYRNRFRLMKTDDEEVQKKWDKNREIAYNGSIRHFLFSLVNDNLEGSGFRVFHVKEIDPRKPLHPKNILSDPYNFLIKPSLLSNEHRIQFTQYIKIVYTREASVKTENLGDIIIVKNQPQVSWLKLRTKDAFVDIYGNQQGTINFELFGYWAGFGVSEMIPKYFIP